MQRRHTVRATRRHRLNLFRLEDRTVPAVKLGLEADLLKTNGMFKHDLAKDPKAAEIRAVEGQTFYLASQQSVTVFRQNDRLAISLPGGRAVLDGLLADTAHPLHGLTVQSTLTDQVFVLTGAEATVTRALERLPGTIAGGYVSPYFTLTDRTEWVIPTDEVMVRLRPGVIPANFFNDAQFVSYERLASTSDTYVAKIRGGSGMTAFYAGVGLNIDTRAEWVTPNFYGSFRPLFTPDDPNYPEQWHLNNIGQAGGTAGADIGVESAWNTTKGAGQVIAIVDTGLELTHPDLAPNIFKNAMEAAGVAGVDDDGNGYIDDINGWDFTSAGGGDNDPGPSTTVDDHATATAGLAAAVGNNTTLVTGVAYEAKILPVRIFQGLTATTTANIASALNYAAGRSKDGLTYWGGATLVSNSWGGGPLSPAFEDAFTWAEANGRAGKGTPYFFAGGNGGGVQNPATYSTTHANVIAVGGSTQTDQYSGFSTGPQLNIAAPTNGSGTFIVTTDRVGTNGYDAGDYTKDFGGTSASTPISAGVGALVFTQAGALTAGELRGYLQNTSDLIDPVAAAYDPVTGVSMLYGHGRVSADTAIANIGKAEVQVIRGGLELADGASTIAFDAFVGNFQEVLVRVRNQGTATLNLSNLKIAGSTNFTISVPFSDTTLSVGELTTVTVKFEPASFGNSNATLQFDSNDADEATYDITLTGLGKIANVLGKVFNDLDFDGVFNNLDTPAPGVVAYLDANANNKFDGFAQAAATPNLAIIDLGTITSTVNVAGLANSIADVNVRLNITHTWDSDLVVSIENPTATVKVNLFSNVGGLGDNFTNTVLDDQAATAITTGTAPFTGSFQPAQPLAGFNGLTGADVNGAWTLTVTDTAGADVGFLLDWDLSITTTGAELSAVTDAMGAYVFSSVPLGKYDVRIDSPGYHITAPAAEEYPVNITAPTDTFPNRDFGRVKTASISGRVFLDANGNGKFDAGDTLSPNVGVYIDANGNNKQDVGETTVKTDAGGNYTFFSLPVGPHDVRVDLTGFSATAPVSGEYNEPFPNKYGKLTGRDFGRIEANSIRGKIYHDQDGDGVLDATEPGLAGRVVFADLNNNGKLDGGTATTYNAVAPDVPVPIVDLATSTSNLTVAGWAGAVGDVNVKINLTHTYDSDIEIILTGPLGQTVSLAKNLGSFGDNYTDTVFDDEAPTSITAGAPPFTGSFKPQNSLAAFDGLDPNGTWTITIIDSVGGDSGTLFDWSVSLSLPTLEPQATSAPDGSYVLTGNPAGNFKVLSVQPPQWVVTQPSSGKYDIVMPAGGFFFNRDFGAIEANSVRGVVYHDQDADGTRDVGEPGLGGRVVFLDLNNNGVPDGATTFNAVAPDVPVPIVDLATSTSNLTVAGWVGVMADVNVKINLTHTYDSDIEITLTGPLGQTVSLANGLGGFGQNYTNTVFDDEAATSITAGAAPFTGTFKPQNALTVYDGLDPNGVWTLTVIDSVGGDSGVLLDWSVSLSLPAPEPQTLSAADGTYLLTGAPVGTYNVRSVQPPFWVVTQPAGGKYNITMPANGFFVNRDFGTVAGNAVYGRVFRDLDLDNVFDAGEAPLANRTVFLDLNSNGKLDGATTYTSTNVPITIPTLGKVQSDLTVAGFVGTVIDVDVKINLTHTYDSDIAISLQGPGGQIIDLSSNNGTFNDNYTNTIFDDEAALSITAGAAPFTGRFQPEQPLTAFDGVDPNGLWSLIVDDTVGGDGGAILGWEIVVFTGIPEPSTVTDAAGKYEFTGLAPATYDVRAVAPTGWQTYTPASGKHTVVVSAGSVALDRNFGQLKSDSIYGAVYVDNNNNKTRDLGEAGVPNQLVYVDTNDNGVFDAPQKIYDAVAPDVPAPIVGAANVNSTITIAGFVGNVGDVDIKLNIDHTWDSDLIVQLTSPTGKTITLIDSNGGAGINFTDTVLDDEAAISITAGSAPFTDSYRPIGLLSTFDGLNPNGVWTMNIVDTFGAADDGVLNSWSIVLSDPEPYSITDATGGYELAGLAAKNHSVRTVVPTGFVQTEPAGGKHVVNVTAGSVTVGKNFGQLAANAIYGTTYIDKNTNSDYDAGDLPLPGVAVFVDGNDNGTLEVDTYQAPGLPLPINDLSTLLSTNTVAGFTAAVADLDVKINLTHTFDADLTIYLTGPTGAKIALSTFNGGGADNYTDTVFDDEAPTSITAGVAPFTGSFQPEEALSKFDGLDPNGVWTLEITDNAGLDIGTLLNWQLDFNGGTQVDELVTASDAVGNYSFTNLTPGTYNVRRVIPAGYTGLEPAGGKHTVVLNLGDTAIGRDFGHITGAAPAAKVSNVKIDNGTIQRSVIRSLTITFDQKMDASVATAFSLSRVGGGVVSFAANVDNTGPTTVVTLNGFNGAETEFASLKDGRYNFSIDATKATAGGVQLDGDNDGKAGGDFVLNSAPAQFSPPNPYPVTPPTGIWRFFGDSDGDDDVDATDRGAFNLPFSASVASIFDFDNDADTDIGDYGAFRARFGGFIA